jgi:hypothetical protein
MNKTFTKGDWIKLIKKYLIKYPEHDGEYKKDYIVPENLIITITEKKTKMNRYHACGGPIYTSMLNFADPERLKIRFLSPSRKPKEINWGKVIAVKLYFFSP